MRLARGWRESSLSPAAEQGDQLPAALLRELKLPLMQVARRAELMRLSTAAGASAAQNEGGAGDQMGAYRDLQASADMALRLLEGYLLSVRVRDPAAGALRLEPLCLASALYDAQQDLMLAAASYGVRLELALKPPSVPVLADKQALHAALVCLGYDLIAGLPAAAAATGGRQRLSLRLAGRHARHGQEVGMYGCLDGLSAETFRRARALHGRARQPLISALPGSGAGVFVADALLRAMSSRLRVSRFHKLPGFAMTLEPSAQLRLV